MSKIWGLQLKAQPKPLESKAGSWCKKCGEALLGDEGESICGACAGE